MPAPRIRADYQILDQISRGFASHAASTEASLRKLRTSMDTLKGGDWIGQGAKKFYQEMDSEVLPAVQRLTKALQEGARVTKQISKIMKQAEDDAARIFQVVGAAVGAFAGGGLGAAAAGVASGLAARPAGEDAGQAAGGEAGTQQTAQASASERLLSQFDPRTRQLVEQSPTLRGELEQLDRERWTIQQGDVSEADPPNRLITIDRSDTPEYQVGGIAHEVAHARYGQTPYHAPTPQMTREEYIRLNVAEHLRDEGNAQLHEYEIRQEILDNGGPDIGVSGTQRQRYDAIYNDYRNGSITRDQAVERMGNVIADDTPGRNGQNYRQYYGETYERHWDNVIAPSRRNR